MMRNGITPAGAGKTWQFNALFRFYWGSPPQVRGKLPIDLDEIVSKRITPAGAGKTWSDYWRNWIAQDHPRRCGENCKHLQQSRKLLGSPPQVRGKRIIGSIHTKQLGITPAGAGKTNTLLTAKVKHRDHPRRCGENNIESIISELQRGSPPQVRGKLIVISTDKFMFRITPAGAGKTGFLVVCTKQAEDHPRRCGENVAYHTKLCVTDGSPPQVRGKLPYRFLGHVGKRITPAGAGKTGFGMRFNYRFEDHPRRCGENIVIDYDWYSKTGSPPQVRGKRGTKPTMTKDQRITPAGAGKTRATILGCPRVRDHPRRCGENFKNRLKPY